MFILKVVAALRSGRVQFAVAGGYAVNMNGVARSTIDLDLVLRWTKPNLRRAEVALNKLGLVSKLPITAAEVFDFRKEYIAKRNLVAWNFYNPRDPSELIDLLIPNDLKDMKTKTVMVEGTRIPVLERSELIKMKRKSGRPQDLEDAAALEKRA